MGEVLAQGGRMTSLALLTLVVFGLFCLVLLIVALVRSRGLAQQADAAVAASSGSPEERWRAVVADLEAAALAKGSSRLLLLVVLLWLAVLVAQLIACGGGFGPLRELLTVVHGEPELDWLEFCLDTRPTLITATVLWLQLMAWGLLGVGSLIWSRRHVFGRPLDRALLRAHRALHQPGDDGFLAYRHALVEDYRRRMNWSVFFWREFWFLGRGCFGVAIGLLVVRVLLLLALPHVSVAVRGAFTPESIFQEYPVVVLKILEVLPVVVMGALDMVMVILAGRLVLWDPLRRRRRDADGVPVLP